jgi:hypothetical protein
VIQALGRAGGTEAEPLLAAVMTRVRWRTPLRTWRIRAAANAAIRAARREPSR